MYSASLEKREFLKIKRLIDKKKYPELHKTITALNKYLLGVRKSCQENQTAFTVERKCPTEFIEYLEDFIIQAENILSHKGTLSFRNPLQDVYYSIAFFIKIVKLAKGLDAFVTTITQKGSDVTIKILCLDAVAQLKDTAEKGIATVYFSATLSPMNYFFHLLGGKEDDRQIQLPSPFPEENLSLNLVNRISTRYRDREMSYQPIADYLTAFVNQKMGNYLICFPSYVYMENVVEQFFPMNMELDLIKQQRAMTEPDREKFLAKFTADREKTLVGFVVMGGIYAESVDLPGERLTGAAIIGVGLPQINKERDLILQYFNHLTGNGFDFAYTFPGMSRVLQAAGRVIRSETDRGSLLLIDDRYTHSSYQRLFPPEWAHMNRVKDRQHLTSILSEFWAEQE
jgi:DNA excision repair protein ERCC-2